MSREEDGETRLSTKDQIGLLTVIAVTVAMGLFFAFQGVKTVVRQARSGSWPAVEATIVAPLQESDSNSQSLMVKYDYVVDGANYTSKWKHLGINVEDPQHYAKVLKDFAVGNHLDVYYDPLEPSQSVIHPGMRWGSLLQLLLGLWALGFAWLGFYVYRRGRTQAALGQSAS